MKTVTFITGNQDKADYLAKYLGHPVEHIKLDLDEIQSLDLKEVVKHKVQQAYEHVQKPVLVEDVSLEFEALGGLPGPFIRFYVDVVPFDVICNMISGPNRRATARCVFGYFDGKEMQLFEGSMKGQIATEPRGENGYGWDKIFIPGGYNITRAEMDEEDNQKTYMTIKPFEAFKKFIESNNDQ